MKKALIITYPFPPINSIASMRFGSLVKYFKSNNWLPYVLTTNSTGDLKVDIEEDMIFRYSNNFIGAIKDRKTYNDSISNARLMIGKIKRKASMSSIVFFSRYRDYFSSWKKEAIGKREEIRKRTGPINVVISTCSPITALQLGGYFSTFFRVPWIADFRDLGALKDYDRYKTTKFIDQYLEKKIVKRASCITTVSNSLKDILYNSYYKRCEVIYNGWVESDNLVGLSLEEEKQRIENAKGIIGKKYFYYAGNLREYCVDSIKALLGAISFTSEDEYYLVIRSLGPAKLEKALIDLSDTLGVRNRLILLEPCELVQAKFEEHNSFCNVVFEDLSLNTNYSKGTLTGKFLKLLPKKPPILFIARPDSDSKEILEFSKKGKLCSNIGEIYDFIKSLSNSSENYKGISENISLFSIESQTRKLCELFDSIIEMN